MVGDTCRVVALTCGTTPLFRSGPGVKIQRYMYLINSTRTREFVQLGNACSSLTNSMNQSLGGRLVGLDKPLYVLYTCTYIHVHVCT